ncbi:MAG: hypothetical protein HXS54_08180 [Theionarchaea archaeon]|nr:hypothetical protein [Theionarchaea archaeon]
MKLTESEKRFLNLIGSNPSLSRSELLNQLEYKRETTISTKLSNLRKAGYIRGPYYHINLNAVGKNPIYNTLAVIRFDPQHYETVFSAIKCIDYWEWIFPTIQGDTLFTFFRSSNFGYLTRLLNLLKRCQMIEYRSYTSQNRWFVQNPDFFGSIFPQVTTLPETTDIALQYPEKSSDTEWRPIDLKMMQYLQVKTCNTGEIQKMEKKVRGRFWKRHEIKYSIQKIIDGGIADGKHYNISPYPRGECYAFLLLVEGNNQDILGFMANFGNTCRMYKTFTMADEVGFVWCWTSPEIGPVLMKRLENLRPHVEVRCLQLKSSGHGDTLKKSFNEEHFNFEKQEWTFSFRKNEKKILKIIEKRKE